MQLPVMGVGRATTSEIESVLYVISTSNRHAYRGLIPAEQFKDPVLTFDQLRKEFANMTFYTYKHRNRVVGVAALGIDKGNTGTVRWVHVRPAHRRRGVGTSLVKHIESQAKKKGLKKIRAVYVWEKAQWAKNFYTKLGYEKKETVSLPWGDLAHVYEKTLT